MSLASIIINNGARDITGDAGHDKARKAHWSSIRRSITEVQRWHKRRYLVPGGGDVNPKPPQPDVIMIRHNTLGKLLDIRLDEGSLEAGYGTDYRIMKFLEEGTGPRTITPKSVESGPLRFRMGGQWISAWSVEHPGIRPRKTLERTALQMGPQIERICGVELSKAGL